MINKAEGSRIDPHAVNERCSLLAHQIYAEEVEADQSYLKLARTLIDQWVANEGGTHGHRMWQELLKRPWSEIRTQMLTDDPDGRLLRSNSPFSMIIGITDIETRRQLWRQAKYRLARELILKSMPAYTEMEAAIIAAFPPCEIRPKFDIPRFWSNPDLNDPDRIISLVLANLTTADLARTIHAYGPDRVVQCLSHMIAGRDLEDQRVEYTIHFLRVTLEGVADAAANIATNPKAKNRSAKQGA